MRKIIIAALGMLLGSSGAWALGTTAETQITNNATLTYSAGTAASESITSADDVFRVDKKIDMVLTTDENVHLGVEPGDNDQVRTFTFENEGNADQHFKFTASDLAQNEKPDYPAPEDKADTGESVDNLEVRCKKNNGDWEGWSSSIVVLVDEDDTIECEVQADIPNTVTNINAIMNIELVATAVTTLAGDVDETESAGDAANGDATPVDVVLADGFDDGTLGDGSASNGEGDTNSANAGARDGKERARGGYILERPTLALSKKSCVISDPLNGDVNAGNHPKRIPGAVIRYMIDIKNTGTADATGITITDNIIDTVSMDYSSISTVDNVHSSVGSAVCDCANETRATESDVDNSTATGTPEVKFEGISVAKPAGGDAENHTCVSFDITIN